MKRFTQFLSIFLLLLLVLLVALPVTAPGTRLLLNMANRFAPIEIDYLSGSLMGELKLRSIYLDLESVSVSLEAIESDLKLACLWRSTVCLKRLSAGQLTVVVAASDVSTENENAVDTVGDESDLMLAFPFAVEVEKLLLEQALIEWPGGSWRQGEMQAGVALAGSTLQFAAAGVSDAQLTLQADTASPSDEDFSPPEISLPLNLLVDELQLEGAHLDTPSAQIHLDTLLVRGTWRGVNLELASLEAKDSDYGELNLSGVLGFYENWPLQITSRYLIGPIVGSAELQGRQVEAEFGGDFSSLDFQLVSAGAQSLMLDGQLSLTATGLPFKTDVVVDWQGHWLLGDLLQEAGELPERLQSVELQAPLLGEVSGNLDHQQFSALATATSVDYPALQIALEGSHHEQVIDLTRLAFSDVTSDSNLIVSGQLQLASGVQLGLAVQTQGLKIPGGSDYFRGRVRGGLNVTATQDGDVWSAELSNIDLAGEVNDLPAIMTGFAGVSDGFKLLAGDVLAQVNGADIRYHNSGVAQAGAQLQIQVDSLSRWRAESSGQLNLTVERDSRGKQLLLSGDIQQLHWDSLKLGTLDLAGSYQFSGQQFDLTGDAGNVLFPGLSFQQLQLRLQGDLASHKLQLSSDGDLTGQLEMAGSWKDSQWRGELAPTHFETRNGPWALSKTVTLAWLGEVGELRVSGHCWQHSQFGFCPGDTLLAASGYSSVKLNGQLSAVNGLIRQDLKLAGVLQLQLDASWEPDTRPQVTGNGTAEDVQITRRFGLDESVSIRLDAVEIALRGDDQGLQVTGDMYRDAKRILEFDTMLPTARAGPLQGRLVFDDLQLDVLEPLVPEVSALKGALSGSLELSGTAVAPLANGVLRLTGGRLALVDNPTEFTDLDLSFELFGDNGTLSGTGLLGGGPLDVQGQLQSKPDWKLELAVSGTHHQILVPPSTEMKVSEELTLVIVPELLDVRGDIIIEEGVLRHEELPEGSVAVSADVFEVDLAGNPLEKGSRWNIRSDVRIEIKNKFEVQGAGLHATLGGNLSVQKKIERPLQVFGSLNIIGGELRAYKQDLKIRGGSIAFTGPPENPELDIAAERMIAAERVTAGAQLQGTLEEPVLRVYSDPVMEQSEAMSYLVRGRGLDSGAGADGTALALTMGADVVNRSGVVSGINSLPGINNVSFGASGSEDDTAATVSGYLGERIYLSYGVGLYEPINVLTARLYLQSRLWLEVVSRLENSIDLYYSFDIE